MTTKVCPCCDQPIQGIYCKGCRKFVFHPVEQDIHYYLNERHPASETDCSYHGNTAAQNNAIQKMTSNPKNRETDSNVRKSEHVMTPYETEAKKAEIKQRMLERQRENNARQTVQPGQSKRTWASVERKKEVRNTRNTGRYSNTAAAGKKILIGLAVYLIIMFGGVIMTIFSSIGDIFDDFNIGVATPESAVAVEVDAPLDALPESAEPDSDMTVDLEDWERTDEEVKAAGIACTGYGHFELTIEDAESEFLEYMKEAGLVCYAEEPYSYNSQMDHDSWYQTVYSYTIETEDEYVGIIDMETDTATGQIHGISLYTIEGEDFFKMADVVMGFMEGTGLVSKELPNGREFYEIAMGNDAKYQKEEGFVVMYDLDVSCYVPEDLDNPDFYSMSIYAPGYYVR